MKFIKTVTSSACTPFMVNVSWPVRLATLGTSVAVDAVDITTTGVGFTATFPHATSIQLTKEMMIKGLCSISFSAAQRFAFAEHGAGADVDSAREQKKLEARKCLTILLTKHTWCHQVEE